MSKTITLKLQVKELIYDVQNKSYLTGKSRESEGTSSYEAASNIKASDEDEDLYQIKRSIANAYSVLKNNISEYLTNVSTQTSNEIDSTIDTTGALTLSLKMPDNFTAAAADSIGANAHAYIVDMALAEWFSITSKADAENYIAHSAIALDAIKRALYKRSRPNRPTYSA